MGRRKAIEDDELLEHARAVFTEQGAFGTVGSVARAAGISEAAVFKRYPTKAALYLAAMTPRIEAGTLVPVDIEDPRAALAEIGRRLLAFFRKTVPMTLQLATHPSASLSDVADHFGPETTGRIMAEIVTWIEARAEAGEVSTANPVASAQMLIAAVHSLAVYELLGLHGGAAFDEAVPQFVEALWAGLAPAVGHTSE